MSVDDAVAAIWADVAARGDAALREATQRLDRADLADPWLADDDWTQLAASTPHDVQRALRNNLSRIEAFHQLQVPTGQELQVEPGLRLGRRPVPHQAVACYVPGGRASYPSTVMMTVPLARLAGVESIVVVTPPRADGSIDPAVAYAARLAGATRILRAGGAQAIAALALGTDQVPAVEAIVGPGNAYVAAAKQRAAAEGRVWTDAPAGPSELLVLCDETASPETMAADLIAQAEHDPDARVVLACTDQATADAIMDSAAEQAAAAPRRAIIEAALQNAVVQVDALDPLIASVDEMAPEHLEVVTRDADQVAARIRNAGSIFIGPWAPVSLGDYGSGTNHVLPTSGQARIRGGLSVADFYKWVTWQEVSEAALTAVADDITIVADAEGLNAHADAVRRRLP